MKHELHKKAKVSMTTFNGFTVVSIGSKRAPLMCDILAGGQWYLPYCLIVEGYCTCGISLYSNKIGQAGVGCQLSLSFSLSACITY